MVVADSPVQTRAAPAETARRFSPLILWAAAAGVVLLVWMTWTFVAWIGAGDVHQITRYRDHGAASWVAAIVYEMFFAMLTLGLIAWVARGAIQARRVTFDAMLLLALLTSSWLDPAFNFYKQIFLYSSQFVNVSAWCAKMPGIVNHECGRMPEPLVIPLLYVQVLLAAILACLLVGRLRARRQGAWSVGRTLVVAGLFGVVFDFAMEMPSLALHLWSYASGPNALAPPGLHGADRYSLTTAFTFGFICASVTALRYHRDDRGLTILERDGFAGANRLRTVLTTLAVIGWVQLTVIVSFAPAMLAAPYAGAWPRGLPRSLVNGLCDNNARGTTTYPCGH